MVDEGRGTMAPPQKEVLRAVTAEERAALDRIVRASSERLDRIRRAKALLAVAQGDGFAQAARQAGLQSGTAVANLVGRFNAQGLAALTIAAGRGRRPTYGTATRAQIVATAQQDPDRRKDGTATWSLSTLQKRLRKEGLEQIGTTTIKRVLEDAGNSYQKTRSWCPTGTAQRVRKAGVVTVVDPKTEEKRGPSSGRIGRQKWPASPCAIRMRQDRIKRFRILGRAGNRRESRTASRMSMCAPAPPSS